jgi:hypothetical protein
MRSASRGAVLVMMLLAREGHGETAPSPGGAPSSAGAVDNEFTPTAPATPVTTYPRPPDPRVWRLVDPSETDWHSPDPNRPRGWFRFDTDGHGASGYVGGSFRIADGLAFAPFVHVMNTIAEPDVALSFNVGPLWLLPAFGTSVDFGQTRAVSLDPQLFLALDAKLLYAEVWAQYFWAAAYHPSATDTFAMRTILLASLGSVVGLGGEWDFTWATHNGPPSSLLSSIVGGRVNVRIGDRDTVGLFVGRQTVGEARIAQEGIAGRLEYVHQW